MRIITIKGFKKTGKTTTCEAVIAELVRRGHTVASVKSTHFPGFTMDTPGRDSHRHGQAGASVTAVIGQEETDVVFRRKMSLEDIIGLFTQDFLVCEGESGMGFANIVTGRTVRDLEERRDEQTIGFAGIISGELKEHDGLPVIDGTKEIERLVDLIEERSTLG